MPDKERIEFVFDMLGITDTQRMILPKIINKKSNQDIAKALNISAKSVEFHKTDLFKKIGGKENLSKFIDDNLGSDYGEFE